jgi:ribose 5-phosphate isomerase B
MKVALGVDHAGFPYKKELETALRAFGAQVIDLGTASEVSVDYPDFAEKVARAVVAGEADRGVLICGTGIGMSIAANKIPGIRAAVVTDEKSAELSRRHNDANIFCAGARILPLLKVVEALKIWLSTPFEGGRHQRRIEKIAGLEKNPCP